VKRHAVRELALKALFACDLGKNEPVTVLEMLWNEEGISQGPREFSKYLVNGVITNLEKLDDMLRENTTEWELDRMAAVDRNILRLALFEMIHSNEVPRAVAFNEAIELGKTFGGIESSRFINGVLGKISKILETTENERG
jgi:N utilization substance protein B